jgi:DNA-binding winged helix-turn-helix (wHTH) protein
MSQQRQIYEFGPFHLEPDEYRLLQDGQKAQLRAKSLDLLAELVRHAGQMLTKDHLLDAVWPDSEVEEGILSVSVNEIRNVIGRQYIETVAGRGYRFAEKVKVLNGNEQAPSSEEDDLSLSGPIPQPGGALPLDSPFYITRTTDAEFHAAIRHCHSFVLVKGAREVGKTSLLARGLHRARKAGTIVMLTNFQQFAAEDFATIENLLMTLAETIAVSLADLDLDILPPQRWNSRISASSNFESYLRREVLAKLEAPLVWGLDDVDRLFDFAYSNDVFGLFRSWHNMRALDPAGSWQRLTLAMAYATEAHLFILDRNLSPFNVGTRLILEDFSFAEINELNRRYGSPLTDAEVARYFNLVGGHPYLVQCGLCEMTNRKVSLSEIEAPADYDKGPFGAHLRRILASLKRDSGLCQAVRDLLLEQKEVATSDFYRLRSAGVLTGNSAQEARPRCELYASYLKKRLS